MTHMEKVAILGKLRNAKNLFQNIGGDVKNLRRGYGDVASTPNATIQDMVRARPDVKGMMSTNFGTQMAHRAPLVTRTLGRDVGVASPFNNMSTKLKTLKELLSALGRDIKGL